MSNECIEKIESKIDTRHRKVCIRVTSAILSVILDNLAQGLSEEETLSEYPSLKKGDVNIAILCASSLARGEIVH